MDIPLVKHPTKNEWMLVANRGHFSFPTRTEALSFAAKVIDENIQSEAMKLCGEWINDHRLEFLEWIYTRAAERYCQSELLLCVSSEERRRIREHIIQECRRVIDSYSEYVRVTGCRIGGDEFEWYNPNVSKFESGLTAWDLSGKERAVIEKAIWRVTESSGVPRERVEMVVVGMILCGDFESVAIRGWGNKSDLEVATCQKINVEFPDDVWRDIWDSVGADSKSIKAFHENGRLTKEPEKMEVKGAQNEQQ